MTHTLGPWIYNPRRGDIIAPSVPKESSRLGHGEERDDIWNYYGGEVVAETVSACDGPLLATAPKLLRTLKEAEKFVDRHSEEWYTSGQQLLKEIRAAISEAEGQ